MVASSCCVEFPGLFMAVDDHGLTLLLFVLGPPKLSMLANGFNIGFEFALFEFAEDEDVVDGDPHGLGMA
eukprot:scaffold175123_cov23-Cyclotella_meneghiniana.AAC.1